MNMDTKTISNAYTVSTDELVHEIKEVPNIEEFLKNNNENMIRQSLSEHLNELLLQKGLTRAKVVRGSLLDRNYVYQIFSGQRIPSRDKLIAVAFGLALSVEETQRMLKISGNRELYPRDERDALIFFSIHKGKKIIEANDMLDRYGFNVLGE